MIESTWRGRLDLLFEYLSTIVKCWRDRSAQIFDLKITFFCFAEDIERNEIGRDL